MILSWIFTSQELSCILASDGRPSAGTPTRPAAPTYRQPQLGQAQV